MRCLAIVVLVAVLLAASCWGDDAADTSTPATPAPSLNPIAEVTPQPTVEPPIPPPADHAPVTAHATADVLANGEELPFKLCSRQIGWEKPGPEAMAPVFQDRRFGDGESPFPQDYTYYLRDFYFPTAFSASANKYWVAFGGFAEVTEPPEMFCDLQELRTQGLFRMIRTLNYGVVEVKRLNNNLVIVAEAGFDGWQETVFPYPATQPYSTSDGVEVVRVVDTLGAALYQESASSGSEAWFETVQYRREGALDFVAIGGILPYATSEVVIPKAQPALRLYSSSPAASGRDGRLVAIDEDGVEAGRMEWSGEYAMWETLGTLSLPPGRYILRFEDEESDWRHFVLLAVDVPLPPGAGSAGQ